MPDAPKADSLAGSVLVVLERNFGERLRQIWQPGRPAWIVMSPFNEPAVRSLWASHPGTNHLTGITSFQFDPDATPEDSFVNCLDTIDLHHGPYSGKTSYTELEVIGAQLTRDVREALHELGFAEFSERADGFVARRSEEEALKQCD